MMSKIILYGKPFGFWLGPTFSVIITSQKGLKTVFQDTKTFHKTQGLNFAPPMARLMGKSASSVAFVNGEHWRDQRKHIDPAFYDLSIYEAAMNQMGEKTLDVIAREKILSDFHPLSQQFTLDVLGLTIFDYDFKSLDKSDHADLKAYNSIAEYITNIGLMLKTSLAYKLVPFYHDSTLSNSVDHFVHMFEELIKISMPRVEKGGKNHTMLDFIVISYKNGEMTHQELIANIFTFFLAGHETTATALAFLIQVLAGEQELQERLRKEVCDVLKGERPSGENVKGLDLLSMTIKENLRLYGPAPMVTREVQRECEVEGVLLKKGDIVGTPLDAINKSSEIFGDPNVFRPEKWRDEKLNAAYTWVPFIAGPRVCIGNHFSLLEQKLFVSRMLQRFKWKFTNKDDHVTCGKETIRTPLAKSITFEEIFE